MIISRRRLEMLLGQPLEGLVPGQHGAVDGVPALRAHHELGVVPAALAEQVALVALVDPLRRQADVRADHARQVLLEAGAVDGCSAEPMKNIVEERFCK